MRSPFFNVQHKRQLKQIDQHHLTLIHLPLYLSCSAGPTGTHPLSNIGYASLQQARLRFSSLDKLVHTHFDRGITPETRAVYDSGWWHYIKICNQYDIAPCQQSFTSCFCCPPFSVSKSMDRQILPLHR